MDYEILRPLLIYKYQREEMHRQDEFVEMMINDQNLVGSIYAKIDHQEIRKHSMVEAAPGIMAHSKQEMM